MEKQPKGREHKGEENAKNSVSHEQRSRGNEGRKMQKKEPNAKKQGRRRERRQALAKHTQTHTDTKQEREKGGGYIGAGVKSCCPRWPCAVPNEAKGCKNRQL